MFFPFQLTRSERFYGTEILSLFILGSQFKTHNNLTLMN